MRRLPCRSAGAAALLALLTPIVALGCGSDGTSWLERQEHVATSRSSIVGGEPSTSEDDFAVFLSHVGNVSFSCGATLLAPNLVVTAKHCVYNFPQGESFCDATGEPQAGTTSGYVTSPIALTDIGLQGGADAKKRMIDGALPQARAIKVIDDKTATLCRHDIAFVVLDKPMTGLPLGKLRLGKRPQEREMIAVAGWGQVEDRFETKFRQRRTGMTIERVGLPVAPPDATGTLGPRTFESGPGPCSGDSGSGAFNLQTSVVFGVVARARFLDLLDPISPCRPDTVAVVYIAVNDYPTELRAAFAAAGAEPWLDGRGAPGYLRFKDDCSSDLECEGGRCVSAGTTGTGTCNVDCAKPIDGLPRSCPAGYVCAGTGLCEAAPPPPAAAPIAPVDPPRASALQESTPQGCAASPARPATSSAWWPWILGACAVLARQLRIRTRSTGRGD